MPPRRPTEVQSLVFDKEQFSRPEARRWSQEHGFSTQYGVDEKANTYRVRQHSPSEYAPRSFRTIPLREGADAVVGKRLSASQVDRAFRRRTHSNPALSSLGAEYLDQVKKVICGACDDERLRDSTAFLQECKALVDECLHSSYHHQHHTYDSDDGEVDVLALSATPNPMLLHNQRDIMEYAKLVADAYLAAPRFEANQVWRWELLAKHIRKFFVRMQRGKNGVKVVFVDGQPFETVDQLREEVARTGVMPISRDYNQHDVFDAQTNLEFRAVHDYIVHIQHGKGADFSMRGEIMAYNAHMHLAPPEAIPALFTEVLAQAAVKNVYGYFAEQKICILPFNYTEIGIEVVGPRK